MSGVDTDPVRLLVDSLRIYSPSSDESEFASFLCGKMKGMGYVRVRIDRAGNAIGETDRGKTRLLLCGHMDTVPGELPVRKTKDAVYGRGAADAKSPLCALLVAGSLASDFGVRVTFAGVTGEESDSRGIKQIIRSGTKFDYAVFGEPGGASKVTIGYRGRVAIHVVVKTQGGHASSPWAHKSALDEFLSLLARLKEYESARAKPGDHYRSISVSPTLVRAGTYHNVVPNLCEATLDLRVPPTMRTSDVLSDIRALAESSGDGSSIEVSPDEATEPYEAKPNSKVVRAFQRAILLRLKARPRLVRKTGTGDMNTFAQPSGAECVTYGPGVTGTSHTERETVSIDDYLKSIEVLKEAIRQLGSLNS